MSIAVLKIVLALLPTVTSADLPTQKTLEVGFGTLEQCIAAIEHQEYKKLLENDYALQELSCRLRYLSCFESRLRCLLQPNDNSTGTAPMQAQVGNRQRGYKYDNGR